MLHLQADKVEMAASHLVVVRVVAQVIQLVGQVVRVRLVKLECGAGNDT
jgi:hypothetical protein